MRKNTEAAQIVHQVKSSSGSIGAKELHARRVVQKALEEEKADKIEPLLDRFKSLLRKLLSEIQ